MSDQSSHIKIAAGMIHGQGQESRGGRVDTTKVRDVPVSRGSDSTPT